MTTNEIEIEKLIIRAKEAEIQTRKLRLSTKIVTISPKPEKVLPASDPNRAVELIDSLIGKVPSFFPN